MKGRSESKGAPSTDLLVCFPSRAHLTLMPKPICSPARSSESNKRRQLHHLRKPATRGAGQASPLLWAKTKPMSHEVAEPTSPKVTCAGQIKVRHKTNACKSWQSVMEEIERIHNIRRSKKRQSTWLDSIGFKKEVMQFLTCLRSIRLDFRCFGAFPQSEITTDDEVDDDEDDDQEHNDDHHRENHVVDNDESSRTVFSKWFMVLQENQKSDNNNNSLTERTEKEERRAADDDRDKKESDGAPVAPPPNALLLMRCRSAPAKSWLEEKEEEEAKAELKEGKKNKKDEPDSENQKKVIVEKKSTRNLRSLMDEEKRNNYKENFVVMTYNTDDFYRLSSDIAKETWVVGGTKDPLSRSRSWKR